MVADGGKLPKYQLIFEDMRRMIFEGRAPEGEQMPTEKELATQYGVSRITSQKAMDMLAAEGLIVRRPGKGSFVTRRDDAPKAPPAPKDGDGENGAGRLIGVVMDSMTTSFGPEILVGIEKACGEHGLSAVIKLSYGEEKREAAHIASLLRLGIHGLIIMCSYDEVYNPLILRLSLDGFPIVFIDRRLNGLSVPYVGTDNIRAAEELTDSMYDAGHKKLTLVSVFNSHVTSTIDERIRGFNLSCLRHGDGMDESRHINSLIRCDDDKYDAATLVENRRIVREFIGRNPDVTGFVALSYSVAAVTEDALRAVERETGVHREVACFDYPFGVISAVKMRYVRQHQSEMGGVAVRRLLERMAGKEPQLVTQLPYDLVIPPCEEC